MTFEELFHMSVDKAKNLFGEETLGRLQKSLDEFNAILEGACCAGTNCGS
jgi:hypothetical protein